MSNVWFTSDTHFGHESMVTKGWRPMFSTIREHDERIIEAWNERVGPRDQVWHLGDFSETVSIEYISHVVGRLNGEIHLIAGNHDMAWPGHRNAHKYQREYFEAGFASVQAFARRKIGDHQVMLSHFPYVGDHTEDDRYDEYRLTDKGFWLIHGHVHEMWTTRGRQLNVGVDRHGFAPISLDTVREYMQ